MNIRRWCLWHPKEGVLLWTANHFPETRKRYTKRNVRPSRQTQCSARRADHR
jgi:hypothetical protein